MQDAQMPERSGNEETEGQQDRVDHATAEELQRRQARRRIVMGGVITAPVILTLKSRALWAQTTTPSAAASLTHASHQPPP